MHTILKYTAAILLATALCVPVSATTVFAEHNQNPDDSQNADQSPFQLRKRKNNDREQQAQPTRNTNNDNRDNQRQSPFGHQNNDGPQSQLFRHQNNEDQRQQSRHQDMQQQQRSAPVQQAQGSDSRSGNLWRLNKADEDQNRRLSNQGPRVAPQQNQQFQQQPRNYQNDSNNRNHYEQQHQQPSQGYRDFGVQSAPHRDDRRYDNRRYDDQPDWKDSRHDFRHDDHRWSSRNFHEWDNGPRHIDRMYHPLPPHHSVFVYGNSRYHYYEGRFYRPFGSSFILVRPPVGLLVFDLPFGFRTVLYGGIPYYVYGDVYYQRVPGGYRVVDPIRPVVSGWPERVYVATELLNVRYAPDENEEVVAQVTGGMELRVLGSSPGWLYVELPDSDIQGWVMEEYVSPN